MNALEEFRELVGLAKQYLLDQYAPSDALFADKETYAHYISASQINRFQKTEPSTQITTMSPFLNKTAPEKPQSDQEKLHPQPNEAPKQSSPGKVELKKIAAIPEVKPTKNDSDIMDSNSQPDPISLFTLNPFENKNRLDLTDVKNTLSALFPSIAISEQIPAAKRDLFSASEIGLTQYIAIAANETPKNQLFLENLVKAISLHIGPAKLLDGEKLEREGAWEQFLKFQNLRLVLTTTATIHRFPGLSKYYREDGKSGRLYLGKVLLHPLVDISHYLKEPSLKKSLWQALQSLNR
jgi:hypothetical protein